MATDDADEAKGTHFLVMEFVEGSDLSALVRKKGPLSVSQALHCIVQAARVLSLLIRRELCIATSNQPTSCWIPQAR